MTHLQKAYYQALYTRGPMDEIELTEALRDKVQGMRVTTRLTNLVLSNMLKIGLVGALTLGGHTIYRAIPPEEIVQKGV